MLKNRELRWKKRQISWLAIFSLLIGVIILVLLQLHRYALSYEAVATNATVSESAQDICNNLKPDVFENVIVPAFSNIAITLIVLGIGSLLIEIYGYASYFRVRLAEVFTDEKIVNLLNDEYKKDLKANLTKSLYNPNTDDSKEILNLFDQKLTNILETYYYDSYDISVEMESIDKKYLKKTITRIAVLREINETVHNSLSNFLSVSCKKIQDDNMQPFELLHVKINKKEVSAYHREKTENELSHYDETFSYVFDKDIEIKNQIEIEVQYATIVPLNDRNYTIRIDKLCKDFEIKFFFNSKEFDVGATGFKFATTKDSSFKYKRYDNMMHAKSNGWLLPGEGVVISVFEKGWQI